MHIHTILYDKSSYLDSYDDIFVDKYNYCGL